MDHRISKDMISSGMTPSGEKAQEDLGRTQYGSNPSPNAFADAYRSIYDKKEEVINEHHKKDEDGNTIPHEEEDLNEGKMPEGLKNYLMKKNGKKEDKKDDMKKEDADLFDLVKGKLIDEGVDEKEALKLMANASQEQLQQIFEMDKLGGITALTTIGGAALMGGKKIIDGVKGMRNKLQQKTQQKNKMMQGM